MHFQSLVKTQNQSTLFFIQSADKLRYSHSLEITFCWQCIQLSRKVTQMEHMLHSL